MKLEGSEYLLPACNDDPHTDKCTVGSPWTDKVSQAMMAGIGQDPKLDGVTLIVQDEFHPSYKLPPHLPKIVDNSGCATTDCQLTVSTVSQNVYAEPVPIFGDFWGQLDVGNIPNAATEIRTKMSSRQRIYDSLHIPADFHTTDEADRCAEINNFSIATAMGMLPKRTADRYAKLGLPLVTGSDLGPYNNGPNWIWNSLTYTEQKDASGKPSSILVQSPMMRTPLDFYIGYSAGFHYCKVLSPARVIEYAYLDGLRAKGGLNVPASESS